MVEKLNHCGKSSSVGENPPIDPNCLIDEAATRIVKNCLTKSEGFILRDQVPDYFVDYEIEIATGGWPSGTRILAQQKGSHKGNFKSGSIIHDFEVKDLIYWIDNCQQLPVLLIVVDVEKEVGYYLFVHRWADQIHGDAWRGQKTKRVEIPLDNRLDEIERFKEAVDEAVASLKERFPGSVPSAAKAKANSLERIDPRFCVSTNYVDGVESHSLEPASEPVTLNLQVSGESSVKRLQELYEFGAKAEFPGEDFTISGSPLFDDSDASKLEIGSPPNTIEAHFVSTNDGKTIWQLDCGISRGKKGVKFTTDTRRYPIHFDLRMEDPRGSGSYSATDLKLRFRMGLWNGKPLLALPYLRQVRLLTEALANNVGLRLDFMIDGNTIMSGTLNRFFDDETMRHLHYLCEVLEAAQSIARMRKREGLVFSSLDDFDWESSKSILRADKLIKGDSIVTDFSQGTVSTTVLCDDLEKLSGLESPAPLRILNRESVSLLGEEIIIGTIARTMTSATIQIDKEKYSNDHDSINDELQVTLVGEQESQFIEEIIHDEEAIQGTEFPD